MLHMCAGEQPVATFQQGGSWSVRESHYHINYLEILATFFALKTLAKSFKDDHVQRLIDNTTAVSAINHMAIQTHVTHSQKKFGNSVYYRVSESAWHTSQGERTLLLTLRKTLGTAEWKLDPQIPPHSFRSFTISPRN